MRVGIVTLYDLNNYGNRLQNYATIHYLQKMGVTAETIIPNEISLRSMYCFARSRLQHKPYYKTWNLRQENHDWVTALDGDDRVKYNRFLDFTYQYIPPVYFRYFKNHAFYQCHQYDYLIAGSDQIWNDTIGQGYGWEYLDFASPEKRISWSASFGIDQLTKNENEVAAYLNDFAAISVREDAGAEIVKQLTGRDAEVLIDPTMMLDGEEWQQIARTPEGVDVTKPYICLYYLGNMDEQIISDVKKYKKEYNMNVYQFFDSSCRGIYTSGPKEFLSLISNASLVMTDSFHACVFSFLFKIPFLVYSRNDSNTSMISRIATLLKKFGLERKFVGNNIPSDVLENNYEYGFQQLQIERMKTETFLKKSMHLL